MSRPLLDSWPEVCADLEETIRQLRRDIEQLHGMLEIEHRVSIELRAEIERLRAALDDCIHGRRDWMEKAKRALERK